MEGLIKDRTVIIPYSPKYERRGFGKRSGDSIILDPVEAVYLALRKDIFVINHESGHYLDFYELFNWGAAINPSFPVYYFAYEDLRERGNKIKLKDNYISVLGRQIKTFIPISERENLSLVELYEIREGIKKGDVILAVVDEESDVIYYKITLAGPKLKGEQNEEIGHIKGHLIRDRVITEDKTIFQKFFYGEERNNLIGLSLVESLYLLKRGELTIYYGRRELSEEYMLKEGEKVEDNFKKRYNVYEDLKERGFVVKTGFKFGSDFRIYDKVDRVTDLPHSKFLVSVIGKREVPMAEISRAVRLAQNVRKKMIFAFNSLRNDDGIKYILIEWIKI